MLQISIVVFALAALGGMYLASLHLKEKPVAIPLALAHGAAAATGLVLLAVAVLGGQANGSAAFALALFVAAALGGFWMFALHAQGKKVPPPMIALHVLGAALGFIMLVVAVIV